MSWEGDRHLLMRAAMSHDLFELATGDIPAPMKNRIVHGASYRAEEVAYLESRFPGEMRYYHARTTRGDIAAIIKAADCLDAVLYLAHEKGDGNLWVGSHQDEPHESVFGSNFMSLCNAWFNMTMLLDTATRPTMDEIVPFLQKLVEYVYNTSPQVVLRHEKP